MEPEQGGVRAATPFPAEAAALEAEELATVAAPEKAGAERRGLADGTSPQDLNVPYKKPDAADLVETAPGRVFGIWRKPHRIGALEALPE